jgi:predicted ABC-class ATPase
MERLRQLCMKIDGKGYKAYKDLLGSYTMAGLTLHIDHVQGDPFAPPSRVRAAADVPAGRFDPQWFTAPHRRTALEDALVRAAAETIRKHFARTGGRGNGGRIAIDTPGQQVLPRTAAIARPDRVEFRLSVELPAAGRTILGEAAARLLCGRLPDIVLETLRGLDPSHLRARIELADQQAAIRAFLKERGYVAFVANGSVLPRESGISDRPLRGDQVIRFRSPASLEVEIPLPHREPIRGMAIPRGVTLIAGGGFHGKSTLLNALVRGVYDHVPGDGREFVITDDSAVKIRAEDGRRVEKVDISPFITHLPFGRDTRRFSTDNASGSTSQAANIIEALEMNAKVLLIDEDTSATNFMIRDARMQELVAKDKEPITPYVDKVRQLFEEHGVSTILVTGGSGDYLGEADTVILMEDYEPSDATATARRIAGKPEHARRKEGGDRFGAISRRVVVPDSLDPASGGKHKADAKGLSHIRYGNHDIDLSFVEQLVDPSQTRAIACMLSVLSRTFADGRTPLADMIGNLYRRIADEGLDIVSPYAGKHPGDLALPRPFELAAAVNRLRSLRVKD